MKYEVLHALKDASPGYVSGEALSRLLNVSRTAIWKYINELRAEDYDIEASTRNGYRLSSKPEHMNSFEIAYKLGNTVVGSKVFYFDTLDSTNDYAKKLASEGCVNGTTVIAGMQTAGKGRLGRNWDSQQDKGIYLSIVLKPQIPPERVQLLTLAASIAVVDALKSVCGVEARIKWPNDIILGGKKVCGILTEMNCETDIINHAVIGIGINYSQNAGDFPGELSDKAISLLTFFHNMEYGKELPDRLELIRALLVELDSCYTLMSGEYTETIIDMWKQRSLTIGREVSVAGRDGKFTGKALDITGDGRLVVACGDGIVREILSGEISVRGVFGYA